MNLLVDQPAQTQRSRADNRGQKMTNSSYPALGVVAASLVLTYPMHSHHFLQVRPKVLGLEP
jgi:hypothetical protein